MMVVYVIHEYGGDSAKLQSAENWAAWLTLHFNALFVVPWVPLCRHWADTKAARKLGMRLDLDFIDRYADRCVAVCGGNSRSPGGKREFERARLDHPIDLSHVDTPDDLSDSDMALLEYAFDTRGPL